MALLDEKVDRLENHFKVYKTDLTDVKEVTKDIRNLLTGTELNGKKGVLQYPHFLCRGFILIRN